MAEQTGQSNILPNNPMRAHKLLEHLKKVKGKMGWYEFNLRCITAYLPDDKVFKGALAEFEAEAAVAAPAPVPAKTTGTKKATTKKADKKKASTKKTPKVVVDKEPGDSLPPTEEDLAELEETIK